MLIVFHKPYGVLSQFTRPPPEGKERQEPKPDRTADLPGEPRNARAGQTRTLAEFGFPKNVYPVGRLDADSEGLLLLSDEPALNERVLHPRHAHAREYWAQVERVPAPGALQKLSCGIVVQGRRTLPCRAWILEPPPDMPPREPPIRFRKSVPTCWIALELVEGKNRQVRRMTAAIGHPTLRLVRVRIGTLRLENLQPGTWKVLSRQEREAVLR